MRLLIDFTSNNSAFDDGTGGAHETARILRVLADRIIKGGEGGYTIVDLNGNKIGTAHFEPSDCERYRQEKDDRLSGDD